MHGEIGINLKEIILYNNGVWFKGVDGRNFYVGIYHDSEVSDIVEALRKSLTIYDAKGE